MALKYNLDPFVPLQELLKGIGHKHHVTSTLRHHTWLLIWSKFLCPHVFYAADCYSGSCLGTLGGKMCICLQLSVLRPLHCSSSVLLPCHPELFRRCRALQRAASANGVWTAKLSMRENYMEIKTLSPLLTVFPFFSTCSGPKRYDWTGERWLYAHDGVTLHQLLSKEFSAIFNRHMDLTSLPVSLEPTPAPDLWLMWLTWWIVNLYFQPPNNPSTLEKQLNYQIVCVSCFVSLKMFFNNILYLFYGDKDIFWSKVWMNRKRNYRNACKI